MFLLGHPRPVHFSMLTSSASLSFYFLGIVILPHVHFYMLTGSVCRVFLLDNLALQTTCAQLHTNFVEWCFFFQVA